MKVSYRWLSDYVDLSGYTAQDLAELLTRGGIEVDVIEERNRGVSGVVVGFVKEKGKHPDADKLSVCQVDAGTGELLQIVCGAPNVAAGQKVPVALIGATLPDGLKIKKAKLRGVESQGMICSARELGLNEKLLPKELQEGILVLPENLPVGAGIVEALALDDQVLELDLTPNRSDCLSMIGVAFEVGAILDRKARLPEANVARFETGEIRAADKFSVSISAPEHCFRYAARVIEGVRPAPSPLWLQNRLMAAGIRPINNIVDVTNYVMLEYGQPLHAFDADRLAGGRIEVRLAREGETIVTLDGVTRKLDTGMLVIADAEKAVALAGVMGGADSEVTEGTTRILLESAHFAGNTVRRTSRQLGLRSEASLRFEKEVNPEGVILALDRAAALIAELAGGRVAAGITEAAVRTHERKTVRLSLEKLNRYLGTSLDAETVAGIFTRLSFECERDGADLAVTVPGRRVDISRDVDLIEEAARIYGYDRIPSTLVSGATTPGRLTKPQLIRRRIRQLLASDGFFETINYSLGHPGKSRRFPALDRDAVPIRVAMPMSEERSLLRTSLIPHLLDAAANNRNRNATDLALFEIGSVFIHRAERLEGLPEEKHRLGLLMSGRRYPDSWTGDAGQADFYDLKGAVEKLLAYLGIAGVEWRAARLEGLHPGRAAEIVVSRGGESVVAGWLGQIHPSLQEEWELGETYAAEMELSILYECADFDVAYATLPRYPSVARDIAVVVGRSVEAARLTEKVREAAGPLLESVRVFDVYADERLGADKKSVAMALVFRHAERTLTDEEVAEAHERIVAALAESFGAELRG